MQKLVVVACAVVLAGLVREGDGQVLGNCPHQELVKNFNELSFAGTWYEFGRYFSFAQLFQSCVYNTFTPGASGIINVVLSFKSFWWSNLWNGKLKRAVPGAANGNFTLTYDSNGFGGNDAKITDANFMVLATDYTSYALVWSCSDALILNFQGLQVLTRAAHPSDAVIEEIQTQVSRRGLSWFFVARTNQNCFT